MPGGGLVSGTYADADGVRLYCEETGTGYPIVFVHEFAGDTASWESQVRYFSRRYRCIAYNARGYAPSDVPEDPSAYGQARAADDIAAVLDRFGIERAHVVGLSMGGFATVHFGLRHAARARSLTVAGCGYGAPPDKHAEFSASARATADRIEEIGMRDFTAEYSRMEARLTLKRKDPRGFDAYLAQFAAHSERGSAMHMRHVQGGRPSLWDFAGALVGARGADAGGLGRYRRRLPGDRHLPQADRPRLQPVDRARHRARGQSGGTRRLQPRARDLLRGGRGAERGLGRIRFGRHWRHGCVPTVMVGEGRPSTFSLFVCLSRMPGQKKLVDGRPSPTMTGRNRGGGSDGTAPYRYPRK